METITLRLNKKLDDELNVLQNKIGVPKHSLIILMIANYLKNNK